MKKKAPVKPQQNTTNGKPVPLAIVGIGCLFPGANNPETYWTNIRDGVDAITEIPSSHWNPDDYFDADKQAADMTYGRRGGFIDPVDFDPLLYGLSPNNIEATDTTQLLGMVVARQALLDAGYSTSKENSDGRAFDRNRTSVILGVTGTLELVIPLGARLGHPIWRKALADAGVDKDTADEVVQRISEGYVPWQENSFPGLLGNVAAGRIANRFDLGGTNCVVDAACASSLSAIHMAALELYAGRSDMAITGGFDTFNDIFMYMCFSKTPALSPTGNSRPFDRNGDGTILGEGLGAVVLKRLDDARRDNDKIYAVIKGIGSSSDGRGNAIYAPSANGQTRALRNAYEQADVSPASIELVEAHGTGTKVGDAVEAEALSSVYRADKADSTWCAIGSVKSMIGHTKAAAGVAGLIKIAMALKCKVLPPTIKIDQPLDILNPGSAPVYVNTNKRPWIGTNEHPRRAAISAFGFGGSNFHCVLEEAEDTKAGIEWDGKVLLLALSADNLKGLQSKLEGFDTHLAGDSLRRVSATSLQKFNPLQSCRLIIVISADADLDKLISNAGRMLQEQKSASWASPDGAFFGSGKPAGKLAMLFPGQGAQYPDMLRDLACQFPQMQEALAEADSIFGPIAHDQRLSDLIFPIPVFSDQARTKNVENLRTTQHAQPAIGAVSLGALRILEHFGVYADATAGHSFGELTALCAADRINHDDLHRLAIKRGELMQMGKGDHGSMLAVSASAAVLHDILEAEQLDLIIANNNAPRQVVLSGATEQIARAVTLLAKRGISAKPLTVSAAFHSSFVSDAEKPFSAFLQSIDFHNSKIPVFANTSSEHYPADMAKAKALLARQLAQPVEFVTQIENMYAEGIRTFIEVGPANILTGLVKSILGDRPNTAIAVDASKGKRSGQYDLACTLAQLAVLGHHCDLAIWDDGWLQKQQNVVESKPGITIKLTGANYVKPRPPGEVRNKKIPSTTSIQNMTKQPEIVSTATTTAQTSTPALPIQHNNPLLQATQQSILALQKMQEQTADLHRRYLEGQETAQRAIQTLLQQQQQLLADGTITPITNPPLPPLTAEPARPAEAPIAAAPAPVAAAPVSTDNTAVRKQNTTGQLETLLLEVIADKTGYPVEMLSMGMSLDTDLGIDSIKRVEILSALQERLPGIRKIQPEDLGTFSLLKHIIEYLAADSKTEAVDEQAKQQSTAVTYAETTFQSALLDVVAGKTGYPVDMLRLDMNLDSDLGIDSIKRVEILSAFQQKMPTAPVVDPEDLATLQTLQQIIDFMQHDAVPTAPASSAPVHNPAPAPSQDFTDALLDVVADKTGYPVDMLRLDMNLDTDLGIDSIKRVEILSAFQQKMPEAPVVDPEDLATLQTLQQIVDFMQHDAMPTAPAHNPAPAQDFTDALLDVVADKTGYPVDMLRLDMNLDTDLGIDSIKRVEILSAFQQKMPAAPVVNPENLATLQTLEQIVGYMNKANQENTTGTVTKAVVTAVQPDQQLWQGMLTLVPLPDSNTRATVHLADMDVVYITDDGTGLSTEICDQFIARNISAKVVAMDATPTDNLAGLIIVAPTNVDNRFTADAFAMMQCFATQLKKAAGQQTALLACITRLGGSFGIEQLSSADPTTAGVAGLIKTADKEWPELNCKCIDIDDKHADGLPAAIVDELLIEGPLEVGIRNQQRHTINLLTATATNQLDTVEQPLVAGDLVVISGGARGITAVIAVELARSCRTNLLLLGRSRTPADEPAWLQQLSDDAAIKKAIISNTNEKLTPKLIEARYRELIAAREICETLARVEAAGVKVQYRSVDIRDSAALKPILEQASRELGPIRGLIHAAGVLADRLIEDKTPEQFEQVWSTKVDGLQALLAANTNADLKMLVMFSSSTGRFGRKGQSDYAAANEVLNKIAQQQQRERPQCRVLSVNWGPWNGGMVTPQLKKIFENEGVGVIPLQAGAKFLIEAISRPGPIEIVVLGSAPREYAHAKTAITTEVGIATDADMHIAFERQVSIKELPVLESHIMNGNAVLPAALIAEWLVHGAMHNNPGLRFIGLDDLRIFKGVIVGADASLPVQIHAGNLQATGEYESVAVELRQGRILHAGARIILGSGHPDADSARLLQPSGTCSLADKDIYTSGRLFHGKALQGIETIYACSDQGISALANSAPAPSSWMRQAVRTNWFMDPLVLDTAFQLMILWCFEQFGNGSLPTRITKYRQFQRSFPKQGTQINIQVISSSSHEVKAMIEFLDNDGKLIARIDGYECVMDASLNDAFKKNKLTSAIHT